MKKYLLALCCLYSTAAAQNSIYSVKPYCNAGIPVNKIIPLQISTAMRQLKTNDLYVFHFKPNACPRCEGIMYALSELLPENTIKLFAVETGSTAAAAKAVSGFITAKNSHVLTDSTGAFRRLIDHTDSEMKVPFVYKLNVFTGSIFYTAPVLGMKVDSSLAAAILGDTTAIECSQRMPPEEKAVEKPNRLWKSSNSLNTAGILFEGFSGMSISAGYIAFTESSSNEVILFSRKGEYFKTLKKDSNEIYHYAATPQEYASLTKLIRKGMARAIYLEPFISKDQKAVLLSASLPDISVRYDSIKKANLVDYRNKPVLISKSLHNSASHSVQLLRIKKPGNPMIPSHGKLYFAGNHYIIPLKKGWPAVGTSNNLLQQQDKNPFNDSFYHYCPTAEITTDTGSIGQFGRLPQFYISHKLGYYYNYISAAHNSSHLALVEKTTGTIQLYSIASLAGQQSPLCTFSIFEEKLRSIAPRKPEDFASPMDYLNSFEKELFRSYILDCLLDETALHLLVKEENKLLYLNYSLNGKLLKKRQYPLQYPASLKQCRLISENNKLLVLGIEQYGNQYSINYLPIN